MRTIEPDTTTHDSIPAETGKNDGDGTSGDCISRQQAIEVLRNRWLKTRNYEGIGEDIAEECEIYLKTLPSVQPNLQPTCNQLAIDCISRQQAIDALRAMQTYKLFAGDDMLLIDQAEAQTELMMLPSVQPERPTGEWIQKPRYEDDEYPDAQPNLKCPFCGYEIGWCDMGNYCARCGADLKGKTNE